jgi:hypothetical protein
VRLPPHLAAMPLLCVHQAQWTSTQHPLSRRLTAHPIRRRPEHAEVGARGEVRGYAGEMVLLSFMTGLGSAIVGVVVTILAAALVFAAVRN